jgi:hypothetical protein
VSFPNPSLRDFLDEALAGSSDIRHVLAEARSAEAVQIIVDHLLSHPAIYACLRHELTDVAADAATKIATSPLGLPAYRWARYIGRIGRALNVSDRIKLLLRLWAVFPSDRLAKAILETTSLLENEGVHVSSFSEKFSVIELIEKSEFQTFPYRQPVSDRVRRNALDRPYEEGKRIPLRDLSEMKTFFDQNSDPSLDRDAKRHVEAVESAINEIEDEIISCSTTFELGFIKSYCVDIAELAGVEFSDIEELFERREQELQEEEGLDDDHDRADVTSNVTRDDSDAAIRSLFDTLR